MPSHRDLRRRDRRYSCRVFSERDAAGLVDAVAGIGVPVWIDGGWGVDALLGRQTRPHADIDLVIPAEHSARFLELIHGQGYAEVATEYTTDFHTVWRDPSRREIDLHLIEFDREGNGLFGPRDMYPAAGLRGRGVIGGREVRCITPEVQLQFHLGYEFGPTDRRDVSALCHAFGLELPAPYR